MIRWQCQACGKWCVAAESPAGIPTQCWTCAGLNEPPLRRESDPNSNPFAGMHEQFTAQHIEEVKERGREEERRGEILKEVAVHAVSKGVMGCASVYAVCALVGLLTALCIALILALIGLLGSVLN